jgi:putative membrane protein
VSILSLAKLMSYLLEHHAVILWSFFFGLIIASVWLVGKTINKWNAGVVVAMLVGTGVAFYIATLQTAGTLAADWYILVCGAIAICAMILPGVSGAFILVLLGAYQVLIDAIESKDLMILGLFAIGCLIGLLTFARVLKLLFEKFKEVTIAVLTGFMVGSLWKVWPWKNEDQNNLLVVHSDGKEDYAMYNVTPLEFSGDHQLLYACLAALGGLLLIIVLERFAPKES